LGSICSKVKPLSFVSPENPAIVFANPSAGRGRGRKYIADIRDFFAANAFPAKFVVPETAEEMDSRVISAVAGGTRVLVGLGGDGTLQRIVNAAAGHDMVLGILPAGGGNDFATALGLPRNPLAAAKLLLDAQPRAVDLARARCADNRIRLYLGGGGLGLDAETAKYSARYNWLPGRGRYIAGALHALRDFDPLQVRAEFPAQSYTAITQKVLVTGILNTPSYGAGLKLAPEARIDDGLLDVLFVSHLSVAQVLRVVPRLLARGNLPERYMQRIAVPRVRLSADRDCVFHGDGEIIGIAPVEVEVAPKALQVLMPTVAY
jgi:diacylglycerol kinase (ATP)